MLTYRMPREPSTPRSSVWRKLRRLGVAQLGDGLVALPADARTREQLEWVAAEVQEASGSAGVWLARPATVAQERELATAMAAARAAEYETLRADAELAMGMGDAGCAPSYAASAGVTSSRRPSATRPSPPSSCSPPRRPPPPVGLTPRW
jgi:hypothetical protein